MSNRALAVMIAGWALVARGCSTPNISAPSVETGLAITNLSKRFYVAVGVRASTAVDVAGEFFRTALLPPGATQRAAMSAALGDGCPLALDVEVLLYRRVHEEIPVGLDEGEEVEAAPIAAGRVLGVPYCEVSPLVDFTIVNWEAPDGTGRVKFAQGTPVDDEIRARGLFPNDDVVWEFAGVEPALADAAPPALAASVPIAGRVTLEDGGGVTAIGVLLRTRFRVRLGAREDGDNPDAGFGEPIAFTATDARGAFSLARPAGAYQVEFFSDDFAFRPAIIRVEAPVSGIRTLAEAITP
jgi:hypothetical protein